MIGKPVGVEELNAVLEEEEDRDKMAKLLADELKAMEVGDCLLYKVSNTLLGSLSFKLFATSLGKDYRVIERDHGIYVYRKA